MIKPTALLLTLLFLPHGYAATPSDERSIEQDLEGEDDKSPNMNRLEDKRLDDDIPLSAEPPPSSPSNNEPTAGGVIPPKPIEEPVAPPAAEAQPTPDVAPLYDGTTRATTSGHGEPIFDWSKHQGEQEVPHPFREKGLIRVSKDRTYYYKTVESDQRRAITFRVGNFHPDKLHNPEEQGQAGSTFDDNYSSSGAPAIMINYEWQLLPSAIGKFGLQAGTGVFIAQGNGHFVDNGRNPNVGLTPREVFTFALIPLNVGVVYRAQFFHRQLFVPYAEGGGSIFNFVEMRDDNHGPKFGASLGAYAAAGGALNLTYFDGISRLALDREYGINAVYLTAEFRQLLSFGKFDFTSNMLAAGFLMEY